jgi:hypothetical protein
LFLRMWVEARQTAGKPIDQQGGTNG